MADRKWNRMILDQIKDQFQTDHVVNELMEVLELSQDSVYRRIRGDTPFTLRDLIRIGRKYRFSLAQITGEEPPFQPHLASPDWDIISYAELDMAWALRKGARIVLRDLPAEMIGGLNALQRIMRPHLPQFPNLGLMQPTQDQITNELIFSSQIMDHFICRIKAMYRQGRIRRSDWNEQIIPEMGVLINRVKALLLDQHSAFIIQTYSPDPALSNLMYIQQDQMDHTYLIHDSGLILTARSGPLFRWIILQMELHKWSSIPQHRLQNSIVHRLVRNWHKEFGYQT